MIGDNIVLALQNAHAINRRISNMHGPQSEPHVHSLLAVHAIHPFPNSKLTGLGLTGPGDVCVHVGLGLHWGPLNVEQALLIAKDGVLTKPLDV